MLHRQNLEVIREQARLRPPDRTAASKDANVELWLTAPLDKVALEKFGAPQGTRWGDLLGSAAELDNEGKKKFQSLSEIEPELMEALDLLGTKSKDGKSDFFDVYFHGSGIGQAKNFAQGFMGMSDDKVEKIRPMLAKIFLSMKENTNLGSALTNTERGLLEQYVASGGRELTPTRARSILKQLLPDVRNSRIETVLSHGKGQPRALPNSNSPSTERTRLKYSEGQ